MFLFFVVFAELNLPSQPDYTPEFFVKEARDMITIIRHMISGGKFP